jgi:hypothetical protein
MKKKNIALGSLLLIGFGALALAASAHFLSASATRSDLNLIVSFREAGLGNRDVTLVASAQATAVYQCINNGGKNPSAENKHSVVASVTNVGTFTPKNGSVRGSLTLVPPGPGNFSCPSGQTLTLISVTYTSVRVTDTTNNVSVNIPGTY